MRRRVPLAARRTLGAELFRGKARGFRSRLVRSVRKLLVFDRSLLHAASRTWSLRPLAHWRSNEAAL